MHEIPDDLPHPARNAAELRAVEEARKSWVRDSYVLSDMVSVNEDGEIRVWAFPAKPD